MKKVMILMCIFLFLFIACDKAEESSSLGDVISRNKENYYPIPYKIECLTLDKKLELIADGMDEITLTAKIYDQYGNVIKGKDDEIIYYEDNELMESNVFKTILPIKHTFKAKLKSLESDKLIIKGIVKSK